MRRMATSLEQLGGRLGLHCGPSELSASLNPNDYCYGAPSEAQLQRLLCQRIAPLDAVAGAQAACAALQGAGSQRRPAGPSHAGAALAARSCCSPQALRPPRAIVQTPTPRSRGCARLGLFCRTGTGGHIFRWLWGRECVSFWALPCGRPAATASLGCAGAASPCRPAASLAVPPSAAAWSPTLSSAGPARAPFAGAAQPAAVAPQAKPAGAGMAEDLFGPHLDLDDDCLRLLLGEDADETSGPCASAAASGGKGGPRAADGPSQKSSATGERGATAAAPAGDAEAASAGEPAGGVHAAHAEQHEDDDIAMLFGEGHRCARTRGCACT